ncbi:MAG: FliM/FliN family flagellar motor switch protein [Alphaproteobacteria bacterium]|nr:FliM/FliN family flagellar motor switch protein [Alphaproteobacteria bacterium]
MDDVYQHSNLSVCVQAVAGKTLLNLGQLNSLQIGDILQLDRRIDEPVDIYVNKALYAKGKVVVADNNLGIVITELIKSGVD